MKNDTPKNSTPTTVVTGYLGSGKTTIILNLIKQLPQDYKVVWLKNEYGNMSIDSELAHENNVQVKEMLNGCLCCVLVGRLKNALNEIQAQFHPDRIIIESSGTAYPLPIVLEISRIPSLKLDGVINVIDVLNFKGYHDKGVVAMMQMECTDLIILNKVGLASDEQVDQVLDHVYELNPATPKVKTNDAYLDKDLLLGLDSKVVDLLDDSHDDGHAEHHAHEDEVKAFEFHSDHAFDLDKVAQILKPLRDLDFIRIKGIVKADGYYLLNWVFGRLTWDKLEKYSGETKIVFMGKGIMANQSKVISALEALTQ